MRMENIYKPIIRMATCLVLLASLTVYTASCSRMDVPDIPGYSNEPISLSNNEVTIGSHGRYYNINVSAVEGFDSLAHVRAATDADWIQLETDTVSRGGMLWFYVSPNEGKTDREATITLSVGQRQLSQSITVKQLCQGLEDGNGTVDSLSRKARVGYGYNMLIDYMDPKSVTEPILDFDKLMQAEESWGTIITQEGRAQQSLSYHSSYSVEEMMAWMTTQTTTEEDFLFVNKSVTRYEQTSDYDLSQQSFGYSSLLKVVATRYLDEGKVQSIIRQGQDLFTQEFRELYDQVNGSPTDDNVSQLVTKFGTHLVTYADLGGRLSYSVNFRSEETSHESVERYMKYKNGKVKDNDENSEASHSIIVSGDGLYFDIYGGTDDAIQALQNDPKTKDPYGQIDVSLLGQWLNSVKASDPNSVSLVRCLMQPIWQLFTNQQARVAIINYILQLAYSESGEVGKRLQELGLDNYYQLDVTAEMQQFGTDTNSTLAKIISYDGHPKVEVCNEYVPELRGDRRVNIFYPIYKGRTNIRRGFFLGDGENAPAEVTFDDKGGCYVRQLEGYGPGDVLTTLYYIDGSFYATNIGIQIPAYTMTLQDEWLHLYGHQGVDTQGNYPVVKIGPGFWTRCNATNMLGFGYEVNNRWKVGEQEMTVNGGTMVFADVFNNLDSQRSNIANFTCMPDSNLWYLPTSADLNALIRYLGNNVKALFHNHMSGFDAQFAGYVVRQDVLTGEIPATVDLKYTGQLCLVAFHDDDKNGQALVIKPDYTWQSAPINPDYQNQYPVRPFRNKKFNHDNN